SAKNEFRNRFQSRIGHTRAKRRKTSNYITGLRTCLAQFVIRIAYTKAIIVSSCKCHSTSNTSGTLKHSLSRSHLCYVVNCLSLGVLLRSLDNSFLECGFTNKASDRCASASDRRTNCRAAEETRSCSSNRLKQVRTLLCKVSNEPVHGIVSAMDTFNLPI